MGLEAKYDKQRSTRPEEVCFVAPATHTAVSTQWPLSGHTVATGKTWAARIQEFEPT